jgi:hypothetical protein
VTKRSVLMVQAFAPGRNGLVSVVSGVVLSYERVPSATGFMPLMDILPKTPRPDRCERAIHCE